MNPCIGFFLTNGVETICELMLSNLDICGIHLYTVYSHIHTKQAHYNNVLHVNTIFVSIISNTYKPYTVSTLKDGCAQTALMHTGFM